MEKITVKIKSENDRIESYFMTLKEASKISGYTPEHLNLLCRKGVLRGRKFGRNWQTTKEWLNEFLYLSKINKKKYSRRKKTKSSILVEQDFLETQSKIFPKNSIEDGEIISFFSENEISRGGEISNEEKEEIFLERKKSPILIRIFLNFSLAVFFAFLIFFGVSFFGYYKNQNRLAEKNIPENISKDSFLFSEKGGIVRGEEIIKKEKEEGRVLGSISESENFRLKEISFGGVLLASASGENIPIEITDIKSEIFSTKDGKHAQILISWKTNKLAISEIEYSSDNKNFKKLEEDFYGFNHSVVLTKLDLATTYFYRISAKDKWGNKIDSEKYGVYSGSKLVSVFDLIVKAVNETFGWAVKK